MKLHNQLIDYGVTHLVMREVELGIVLAQQFEHCLLPELVAELSSDLERKLLVHLCQYFICTTAAKFYLVAASIQPLQFEHGRVFICDMDLRNHTSSNDNH